MYVCPSVIIEQLGYQWKEFNETGYVINFRKPLRKKSQISLNYDKNKMYFNPLNTKRRPLCLQTQFVPRSKHF